MCREACAGPRPHRPARAPSSPSTSPGIKEGLLRQLYATVEGHEGGRAPQPGRVRFRATRWWTAIWASAAVAFACITFLVVENRELDQQVDGMRADVAQLQSQVQDAQSNVALFSAKDTVRVALAPSRISAAPTPAFATTPASAKPSIPIPSPLQLPRTKATNSGWFQPKANRSALASSLQPQAQAQKCS